MPDTYPIIINPNPNLHPDYNKESNRNPPQYIARYKMPINAISLSPLPITTHNLKEPNPHQPHNSRRNTRQHCRTPSSRSPQEGRTSRVRAICSADATVGADGVGRGDAWGLCFRGELGRTDQSDCSCGGRGDGGGSVGCCAVEGWDRAGC